MVFFFLTKLEGKKQVKYNNYLNLSQKKSYKTWQMIGDGSLKHGEYNKIN
jgi:hypothetical protein